MPCLRIAVMRPSFLHELARSPKVLHDILDHEVAKAREPRDTKEGHPRKQDTQFCQQQQGPIQSDHDDEVADHQDPVDGQRKKRGQRELLGELVKTPRKRTRQAVQVLQESAQKTQDAAQLGTNEPSQRTTVVRTTLRQVTPTFQPA